MNIKEVMENPDVDFSGIESPYFLIGLLSAFENRFQAMADKTIGEISWKQFFAIVCINMCRENPTIKELADILGSSHQNVKQILLKLEQKGFIEMYADEHDRRKQRISLTKHCMEFCEKNDGKSMRIMEKLFEGLSEQQLQTTIAAIIQIENNMKQMQEDLL